MGAKGKLRIVPNGHAVYCPGCEEYHVVYNTWEFNGNYDFPTFSPSLLVRGYSERFRQDFVCHSFIRDGVWQFLSDCSHQMKSQNVPLREEESHREI